MKTLIAVMTCHKPEYQSKIEAQRNTWVKDVRGADLVFFKGLSVYRNVLGVQPPSDEVWLDVDDDYKQLKLKTTAIVRWALETQAMNTSGRLMMTFTSDLRGCLLCRFSTTAGLPWKCQNHPPRRHTTLGRSLGSHPQRRSASVGCTASHVMRWESCLNLKPTSITNTKTFWVGQKLFDGGIEPFQLGGYIKKPCTHGVPNGSPNQVQPLPDNHVIASCEYTAQQLREVHEAFN